MKVLILEDLEFAQNDTLLKQAHLLSFYSSLPWATLGSKKLPLYVKGVMSLKNFI